VAGFNEFSLLVRGAGNRPIADAEKVALIFTMREHDMGQNELVLEPQGGGWYSGSTGLTSMIGTWDAEALVRRAGRDDVRAGFVLGLGDPAAPPGEAGSVVASGTTGAATTPGAAGTPGSLVTPVAPSEARSLRNPVPVDAQSLAAGKLVYEQNCMVCHGAQGKGDGPVARSLRPPPADLSQHVTQHTEGELWWWITNGVAGTQMPAWKTVLSDVERWEVLNYIKATFAVSTQ
jgi:mono/diheme cytochrome c family protein